MTALYAIRPGMTARLMDGGTLTVVDVLRSNRGVLSLVLHAGGLHGRQQVVASFDAVSHVDGVVHLRLSERQVQALPAYNPLLR
jgi:hypothetical protein